MTPRLVVLIVAVWGFITAAGAAPCGAVESWADRRLTITDGRVVGSAGIKNTQGGGVLNSGSTLTLANDVLSNNEALGAPGGNGWGGVMRRSSTPGSR